MSGYTRIVEPVKFVPSMMTSTTAVDPEPTWAAGTYAKGAVVLRQVLATKGHMRGLPQLRRFESLADGNTATPGEDVTKWLDVGPANTVAMFDDKISTRTTAAGALAVVLAPGRIVTTVALFGLAGSAVTVTIKDGAAVTYTETRSLVAENIANWFEYFTAPFEQAGRAMFDNLPCYASSTLEVSIASTGAAGVGHVSFGQSFEIGSCPSTGAAVGTDDFSAKETDEYGDTEFVERPYAKWQTLTLKVDKGQVNAVTRVLDRLRATPTVLIASDDPEYAEVLINFGWVGSHQMVLSQPMFSLLDVEFKGLS